MKVLNALQMKKGAKSDGHSASASLTQPVQFISAKKKDADWSAWNIDWLEVQGMDYLRKASRKILKNYKLAKGIIDKTDYIVEEDNDYKDLMDVLTKEDDSALELKFYPIIPNVVNVQFRAVDDTSYNEMLEKKRALVEENLLTDAKMQLTMKLAEAGMDPASEEAQKALDPEQIKSLPEIEDFFSKDYRILSKVS